MRKQRLYKASVSLVTIIDNREVAVRQEYHLTAEYPEEAEAKMVSFIEKRYGRGDILSCNVNVKVLEFPIHPTQLHVMK